jgi:energy-coupling factor transporter ATP-binding protein EcfA2
MSHEVADAEEFIGASATYAPQNDDDDIYPPPSVAVRAIPTEQASPGAPTQWALYKSGYKATTATAPELKPGCYDIEEDSNGLYAVPSLPPSGLLLELPEMRSEHVLQLVERFWDSEADYKTGNEFVRGGAAYRCGVMLFGPPGSGKSTTIKIVCKKLIARGGTVFFAENHPAQTSAFLSDFARIEKNRKCVVILEDLDSLIDNFGEAGYLQMLDSAKTIDNVLFVATTNYPEKLDPRIYNRPGRFSHVVKIGLPTEAARVAYLKAVLKNHRDVEKIVALTDGFSVDHLSALVSAVYREKKELEAEIARLRALFKVPKAGEQGPLGITG